MTDDTIATLTKECRLLLHIDISQCTKLTEVAGHQIAQNCDKLKSLKAAYCQTVINDTTLKKIAANCKNINTLDISYCKGITDEALDVFSRAKRSFVMLLINGLENITSLGFVGLIRNSYSTLEHLEMSLLDSVCCCTRIN